jgi:hypothetical protein
MIVKLARLRTTPDSVTTHSPKHAMQEHLEGLTMEERIMTLHPDGKQGVNISKQKYAIMRQTILDALRAQGEVTFTDLIEIVRSELAGTFEGSINWYVTTVKLDLEARGEIERIPPSSPQRLRLTARSL